MKSLLPVLAALISCPAIGNAADFIRQIQTVNGKTVIYDLPVTGDSGTTNSQPIGGEMATFQLYAGYKDSNNQSKLTLLSEKSIGTFLPTVTVKVLSIDPHVPARTRADQPYGIEVVVSGMQSGAGVPDYAKKVNVVRSYSVYDPKTYASSGSVGEYSGSFAFYENGTYKTNAIFSQLPSQTPTKTSGEETFTAYMQSSSSNTFSQLAKATIKIWPVTTASINGIEANRIYQNVPSAGSIVFKDVYPQSLVYAQVYKGPQKTGTTGTTLPDWTYNLKDSTSEVPQNPMLPLSYLDSVVKGDGTYTVEVLSVTPFKNGAPEILTTVTFGLKRSISINGSVNTME